MEIDGDDGKSVPGPALRVPAVGPAVVETALRPAVDQQRNRGFGVRRQPGRLHHPAMDLVAICTGKAELFRLSQFDPGKFVRIHRRQSRHRAIFVDPEQIGRRGQRFHRNQRTIANRQYVGHRPVTSQLIDPAGRNIHPVRRHLANALGLDQDRPRIWRPGDRLHRPVPATRQRPHLASLQVAQHHNFPVRFISGALHRGPGKQATVGGHGGIGIRRQISGSEIDRRR